MTAAQPDAPGNLWSTNRGVVAIGFLVLQLVFFASDSVGVPSNAYVKGDVGGTPYQAVWFDYAFLISAALIMPLVGSLRERIGAKAIVTLGAGLFGLANLLAASVSDPGLFIVLRVLAGLGGGVIPPIAGGYLGGQLGEKYATMGKGLVGLTLVVGSSAGIPLAALITWNANWRTLYLVVGLISLAAVAVIVRLMPATPGNPQVSIDWLGYGLMAAGFGLLVSALVVGNQREWLASSSFIVLLWLALLVIGLFAWRVIRVPKLINLLIFKDVNYCISTFILSTVLFFLFMAFAIVPRFLVAVLDNTIETYAWVFVPFVGTVTLAAVLVTPGISPWLPARTPTAKKRLCSLAIALFGLTALWMAHTSSQQDNATITLQLMTIGALFPLITCLEVQMSFATMPGALMTSASSVLFFCTNISKAFSATMSSAILTFTSQGSWERFRSLIDPANPALAGFQQPLGERPLGISGDLWSQGSLQLINQAIGKQVEVVFFINIATMVGITLLVLCVLPQLHTSPQADGAPKLPANGSSSRQP
jgi:MFS transporter, DHA2 family, multidrug resistance protein